MTNAQVTNTPVTDAQGAMMLAALRQVPLFANTTDEELRWVTAQGAEIRLSAGDWLLTEGEPADYCYVLLEGSMQLTKKLANQDTLINIFQGGTVFGEIPILLGVPYFVSMRALTSSYLLRLSKDCFWQMVTGCPVISQAILQTMAERMQIFLSVSQQQQKLISLGTLAAGLAHEFNNPAAAIRRSARNLQEIMQALPSLTLKLQQQLTPAKRLFLTDLVHPITEHPRSVRLDPLTQSDREDEITDWLETHGVADGWKLSPTLVAAGLDTEWLNAVVDQVPPEALRDVLVWLEATLTGRGLLDEIKHGSTRVAELVQDIKEYAYLDQAPLQQLDVHEGLESILTLLGHKLKEGVVVTREYDPNLPSICAYGNELNQVWTNLIDNAIDAMNGQGQLWVRTSRQNDDVFVEIADNGPGIPPEIQP
ncbi:MAG TPA: cyclic nucleotide-binding domain-containing protein, partial [Candidatus Caenarcaniphilales bacterium]